MLSNKFFPYSSMQEINLDWILTKVKNLLRFLPDDGSVGQILRRTAHGAEWSNEQGGGGGGAVDSVNGQTGAVVLTASDVGALPDTYAAPVDSVNGQTGAVVLTIPTDTGDLTNGAGYVDAAGAAAAAPVQSVNGQTGAVVISTPQTAQRAALLDGDAGITMFGVVIKDANSNTARLYMTARSTSNITPSTVLAVIPDGYRPAVNTSLYGFFYTSSGVSAVYYGTAGASGYITQALGSTIREVFLCGEYML